MQSEATPLMSRQKAPSSVLDRSANNTAGGYAASFMTEPPQIALQQNHFPMKIISGANNTFKSSMGGFEINKNILKLGTAGAQNRPVNYMNQRNAIDSTAYDTSHSMMHSRLNNYQNKMAGNS